MRGEKIKKSGFEQQQIETGSPCLISDVVIQRHGFIVLHAEDSTLPLDLSPSLVTPSHLLFGTHACARPAPGASHGHTPSAATLLLLLLLLMLLLGGLQALVNETAEGVRAGKVLPEVPDDQRVMAQYAALDKSGKALQVQLCMMACDMCYIIF